MVQVGSLQLGDLRYRFAVVMRKKYKKYCLFKSPKVLMAFSYSWLIWFDLIVVLFKVSLHILLMHILITLCHTSICAFICIIQIGPDRPLCPLLIQTTTARSPPGKTTIWQPTLSVSRTRKASQWAGFKTTAFLNLCRFLQHHCSPLMAPELY